MCLSYVGKTVVDEYVLFESRIMTCNDTWAEIVIRDDTNEFSLIEQEFA
jgi:hypothetical protein